MNATSSGLRNIQSKIYVQQKFPIPPLPVQERIVQILQKADEIRHKRKEALDLADAILPSIFNDMFSGSGKWPIATIGNLCAIKGGKRLPKGSHYSNVPTHYRYLRATDIANGRINVSGMMFLSKETQQKIARYTTSPSDIVISIAGEAGITAHVPVYGTEIWNLTENMALLRCLHNSKNQVLPTYLLWFLRSEIGQSQIKLRAASSTIQKLALFRLASIEVPVPPLELQEVFEQECIRAEQSIMNLETGKLEAIKISDCLLSCAFSGELTAEWEAINADWIASQVKLQERLPRLLLLALVRERVAYTKQTAKTEVFITALMKYAFLFQMEGSGRRRFYHFVPYHYGPFSKELYTDLERLQADGLVTVVNDTDKDKTRITLTDPSQADEALADLSEDIKEDVASIIYTYGHLDHNTLLKTVYEKYPAYTKKSRLDKNRRSK